MLRSQRGGLALGWRLPRLPGAICLHPHIIHTIGLSGISQEFTGINSCGAFGNIAGDRVNQVVQPMKIFGPSQQRRKFESVVEKSFFLINEAILIGLEWTGEFLSARPLNQPH